ncbi:hypothetical protein [Desulfobulbus alkaliphilus]|uniref:hypothetical protein n=1 Tax=Desulfobulbus alkaliphilus TaxID=869814 RepID=UPI0019630C76|nr:hypothetical protein [Desulfobulbus alkaliphilus]MBM9538598.1 hypothetical protein [Desulfobulbus alkaliphilus]
MFQGSAWANDTTVCPPAQYLEIVIRYDLQISDIFQEQLGQMVNQTIKHDVEDVIMTNYEKLRL